MSPHTLAQAWLGVGERERALHQLEAAASERAPQLVRLKVDPTFAPLRGEPRFQQIIDRVG